jgi:hypothetical protein
MVDVGISTKKDVSAILLPLQLTYDSCNRGIYEGFELIIFNLKCII